MPGSPSGLRADDAPPLDRWLRYVYYQHEVIRYLEVVALAGAPATTITPTLAVTDADRAEAAEVLGPAGRPRVALHPGATDTRRRWPAERFAEVARALHEDGYEVLVTGTPSEQEVVDRVVAAAQVPVRPQVGTLSLGGLVGCYADCALVVSNDTGPLHLAAAVGAPTVGIFWVGNLINGASPLRGRHRPISSWTVHCPVCGVDCTPGIYPHRPGDGECPHRDSFVDRRTGDRGAGSRPGVAHPVGQAGCGVSSSARTTSHASTSRSVTVVGDSRWYAPLGRMPAPP